MYVQVIYSVQLNVNLFLFFGVLLLLLLLLLLKFQQQLDNYMLFYYHNKHSFIKKKINKNNNNNIKMQIRNCCLTVLALDLLGVLLSSLAN